MNDSIRTTILFMFILWVVVNGIEVLSKRYVDYKLERAKIEQTKNCPKEGNNKMCTYYISGTSLVRHCEESLTFTVALAIFILGILVYAYINREK